MVFLDDTFEPGTISTTIVFLGNQVLDVMHRLVEGKPLALCYKRYTWLVTLEFCTPMVRIDGKFADGFHVCLSVAHTEEHMCLVGSIVLCRGAAYKCCYFHIGSSILYIMYDFSLSCLRVPAWSLRLSPGIGRMLDCRSHAQ